MPFPLLSLADFRARVAAHGKALYPGLNFASESSYHGKQSTFIAGAATELASHLLSAQRDLHPLTAGDGKPINDWGFATGVDRDGATPARAASCLRVRGSAGSSVLSGTQLRHPQTGLLFAISNPAGITIPGVAGVDPDSFFDADLVAIDIGSQTRLDAGETLNFLAAPPGIQGAAVLVKDLNQDGFDTEQFGSYRGRILSTFRETRTGGSAQDFIQWVEASLTTVHKGYSFPNRAGKATIDLAGFYAGQGSARSLSALDRAAVLTYVQTKVNAPFYVTSGGATRVLTTVADPQRIEIAITPTGVKSYAFDWDDSTHPTVASYNAAAGEVQFSGGALPASLQAGDGIMFDGVVGGSGVNAQDGTPYVVEAISAVDKVILQSKPPVNPAAGDKIYSGGPLVAPIRNAIVGHINGETVYAGRGLTPIPESQAFPANPTGPNIVGLDILSEGMGPANPGNKYGDWAGGIVLATLYRIATYKAGVRNITIVTPNADYNPLDDPFPADAQIHFVTPLVVLIRSA